MPHFTSTASGIQTWSPFKTYLMQTFSLKRKQICPKGPVLLIWCSSHTDPNIMHFPSPENLHTAQQTDKYLIGQASVPSPHGSSYSGHESSSGCGCHVSLWELKPMWAKSAPVHLRTPLRLVLAAPVCLARSAAQMPGHNRWINTKTQNNYKGLLPFP